MKIITTILICVFSTCIFSECKSESYIIFCSQDYCLKIKKEELKKHIQVKTTTDELSIDSTKIKIYDRYMNSEADITIDVSSLDYPFFVSNLDELHLLLFYDSAFVSIIKNNEFEILYKGEKIKHKLRHKRKCIMGEQHEWYEVVVNKKIVLFLPISV